MFLQSVIRALFDNVSAEIGRGHLAGYSDAIKQESEDTDRERLKNGQYLDFGERATRQQFGTKDKDILGSSMKVSKLGLLDII